MASFKDRELLLSEKSQSESRIVTRSYQQRRRFSFLTTICTICFAASLGAFGIFVSMTFYDCMVEGNLETNATDTDFEAGDVVSNSPQCSSIPHTNRQDCWPQSGVVTQHKCEQKGCCWNPFYGNSPMLGGVPFCFYPSDYQGYTVTSVQKSDTGMKVMLRLQQPSGWPNDVQNVALDVTFDTAQRLSFKFFDPNNARYEVPVKVSRSTNHVTAANTEYNVDIPSQGRFYITVTRKSSGQVLFSTQGASPLVFADQFIQLGTQLSTKYIYGLGEHRAAFLVSTNWTKLAFWSRDQPPSRHSNLYGVHPFYLNIEEDHNAHGVFLLNSNAMEVEVQPAPALTYRTTGGVLDFFVFTGPTPDNVVQQYTELIGRPFMPPYWALGFHLCRWKYGGIDGMKKVIKRMRDAKMPFDTQWNDIDYMRKHLDWTYDTKTFNGLPDVVADLHQHGQHYIMIIDPGISNVQPSGSYPAYDDGLKMDIFIKKPDGSAPIIGTVWPGTTAFPDFFHPNSSAYWLQQAKAYHDMVPFDGIWIDMNEPSNFVAGSESGCPDNTLENPPFVPPVLLGGKLKDKTLCASAKQHISSHYNLHSLYGHSEAIATKSALDIIKGGNTRSIVISRSTYPSTGVHSGHWLGDNNAQWTDSYYSIPGILNFNLFGIPLVGADICGFNGNTNTELCTRWMQLGAFYPFMRNHNTFGTVDQDPAAFDQATQKIMRDALNLRYTLLPYLYTLFYRSHVDGLPVVRPLFFQYPVSDYNVTYMTDVQFMWGSALLITPTTSQNTYKGMGYLPKDRWYDWFNHSYIDSPGHYITFDLPMEHINLQVRGGSIIPLQSPNVTTTLARKNNFIIYAALDVSGSASGELYWDDGESMVDNIIIWPNQITIWSTIRWLL
ncbi:lysosomal alpha-glucosidase-like isoform X2 [Mercenaria mercenaria]|uniref:lysosomal alpha-glucosidase-like isoform X2 n=1 Tax=Mercenaria mercenaria TaxID=6596 RepID=UPI00234E890A|nr:lysosomal alpha-glucosidase-like isoform X2 [Mercenaria mercenaria]